MTPAGDFVDAIAQRVRDPSNTAHPRADIRDVLNRVQTIINANQALVLETIPLTLVPGQTLYPLETDLPSLVTVTDIEFENRFLDRIPWRNLWKVSNTWLSGDNHEPRAWAMIGRTLLAVYPVPAVSTVVAVKGPIITRLLTDDNVPVNLRDEEMDIVVDLTTAVLLLRQRDLQNSALLTARAVDKLGLQADAIDEEMRIEKL